jgi:hypothetical protein
LGVSRYVGGASPHLVGARVETQVSDFQHDRALLRSAPGDSAQPGGQFGDGERLGQVVVGPGVEARDPVVDSVAGGEQQDRHPAVLLTQPSHDREAIRGRDHDIEDHCVVVVLEPAPQRVLASGGDIDGVAFTRKGPAEKVGEAQVVLDDEHAHTGQRKRVPDQVGRHARHGARRELRAA